MIPVSRCVDPFGGSGTTALACQFLGIHPVTSEVNPFLADLIEAKLYPYTAAASLRRDLSQVLASIDSNDAVCLDEFYSEAPATLIEPGRNSRWVFSRVLAEQVLRIRKSIELIELDAHRRLFTVLLGSVLVPLCNTYISGKGRRYRRAWQDRIISADDALTAFEQSAERAILQIEQYGQRRVRTYELLRGDSRINLAHIDECQLAVLSPPYPNSSDYTDVYNIELWILGYLGSQSDSSRLRAATLSSHVQLKRDFDSPPEGSPRLDRILSNLQTARAELWNRHIPEMLGSYFSELKQLLERLAGRLSVGAEAWIVVGDSQYRDVQIPVAEILSDILEDSSWERVSLEQLRVMNTSPQQGGQRSLPEHLLVLRKH